MQIRLVLPMLHVLPVQTVMTGLVRLAVATWKSPSFLPPSILSILREAMMTVLLRPILKKRSGDYN